MLKVGQKINQKDFAEKFGHVFTRKNTVKTREEAAYHAFMAGRKIGILRVLSTTELGHRITYEDFIKVKLMVYFMKQQTDSKILNQKVMKAIKDYLLDSENKTLSDKTIKIIVNSIRSYFEKNDVSNRFKVFR